MNENPKEYIELPYPLKSYRSLPMPSEGIWTKYFDNCFGKACHEYSGFYLLEDGHLLWAPNWNALIQRCGFRTK